MSDQRIMVPGTNLYPVDFKGGGWRKMVPGTNFGAAL
jgi:hypothetical protein